MTAEKLTVGVVKGGVILFRLVIRFEIGFVIVSLAVTVGKAPPGRLQAGISMKPWVFTDAPLRVPITN